MWWQGTSGWLCLKWADETLTHTNTHIHTQMEALNPTPKHLFRVFLSSSETKELELLKTWNFSIKSLEVPWDANYRLSEVPLITEDSPNHKLSMGDLKQVKKSWLSSEQSYLIKQQGQFLYKVLLEWEGEGSLEVLISERSENWFRPFRWRY